jgi:hypothetical protein
MGSSAVSVVVFIISVDQKFLSYRIHQMRASIFFDKVMESFVSDEVSATYFNCVQGGSSALCRN